MIDKATEKKIVDYLKCIRLLLSVEKGEADTGPVVSVIEQMPALEKEVITRKYIHRDSSYATHIGIYKDLEINQATYNKIRFRGLYKLGISLGFIDGALVKGNLKCTNSKDRRRGRLRKEIFLSEQDEDQLVSFLYELGMHITIGIEHDSLTDLQQAMGKLEPTGAEIITRKYLSREADYTRHQQIYKEMGLSAAHYKIHRLRALTKLSQALGFTKALAVEEGASIDVP